GMQPDKNDVQPPMKAGDIITDENGQPMLTLSGTLMRASIDEAEIIGERKPKSDSTENKSSFLKKLYHKSGLADFVSSLKNYSLDMHTNADVSLGVQAGFKIKESGVVVGAE